VIKGAAVGWEPWYWKLTGGWPSERRMTPGDNRAYDDTFRSLVQAKLDALVGSPTSGLPVARRFALARAELRKQSQDARAEAFNAIYGLSRGLLMAGAICVIAFVIAAAFGHDVVRNLLAAVIVGAAAVPIGMRFHRFSFYFADQVWQDFVVFGPGG
jgi:hypothetical protein